MVNWTNDDLYAADGKQVRLGNGQEYRLYLFNGWWYLGTKYEHLDFVDMRALLNGTEAVVSS